MIVHAKCSRCTYSKAKVIDCMECAHARLLVAAERERCAAICDARRVGPMSRDQWLVANDCAQAIRADE